MPRVRAVHRQLTRVLSALLLVLGVAVAVSALVRGGGPLSVGVVVGVLLAALGAGRLLLARQDSPSPRA
jgi:hypothetical protein